MEPMASPIGKDAMDTARAPQDHPDQMRRPVVAVFNSSDDTVELLRTALEQQGLHTVAGSIPDLKKGEVDFIGFVEHHKPTVIVYDISVPYEPNWTFLRLVRSSERAKACRFVLTTTNKPALEALVGETETLEIIGKPYDLQRVIEAVQKGLGHVS